jgi:uncharacterized membrane protein YfcA
MSVQVFFLLVVGIAAGVLSGLFGIGGGIIIIPVLVFFFGFSQHLAQGTTLALMVPPIGLLAAWAYYKAGFVDLKAAGLICLGFVAGSVCSARFAVEIPDAMLRKIFGGVLLLVSLKMIFTK